MAVVEIAKIQIRRGDARTQGMPQLDTGELGWAISGTQPYSTTPELFIGNKTADGAPSTTNTRILTVLDLPNIFGSSITTSTYYYESHRTVSVYTGAGNTNLTRTVKEKLDDFVSLFDFVTVANYQNSSYDFTTTLQRAINELFLNSDKADPKSRTSLKIPAGKYKITDTIYVPPHASIVGEGKDKTVISLNTSTKAIFQFVDQTSTAGSPVTLNNFLSNTSPRNILISGMTLSYENNIIADSTLPLLRADACLDTIIEDVKFTGTSTYAVSNTSNAGIEIRGLAGITSKNLKITNCIFENLYVGVKSDYDIEDTLIDSNRFANLFKGISYAEDLQAGNYIGPLKTRVTRNIFSTIAREAVKVAGTATQYTNHILADNIYTNVGNNSSIASPGQGDIGGQTSNILFFGTSGNVSDYDTFDRITQINNTSTTANFIVPVYGHVSLVDHRVSSVSLLSGSATGTIVKVAHSGVSTNIKLQYQITTAGISRYGDLHLVCSAATTIPDGANLPIIPVVDHYNFYGANDTGIVFDGRFDATNNTIQINYVGNTVDGILTYQINQFY